MWPDVEQAGQWIREAAAILDNPDQTAGSVVRHRYECWLEQLDWQCRQPDMSCSLRAAGQHFLKVSRSYGADLFHCYDISGLPRTNNVLEHTFGSLRYHERRASGRKVASPSLVLTGSVRLPAALATRTQEVTVSMLAAVPHARWLSARAELEKRRHARRLRYRFRKNPAAYLDSLEQASSKLCLPT